MSDQEPGRGHHVLTKLAVHNLFQQLAPGGQLLGMNEQDFSTKLDRAQEHADRHPVGMFRRGEEQGWGDTWMSSRDNPAAQARHAVADPSKSAEANIHAIRTFIVESLVAAKAAHATGSIED